MKKYGLKLTASTFLIVDTSPASIEIACEWQACMGGQVFLRDLTCANAAQNLVSTVKRRKQLNCISTFSTSLISILFFSDRKCSPQIACLALVKRPSSSVQHCFKRLSKRFKVLQSTYNTQPIIVLAAFLLQHQFL